MRAKLLTIENYFKYFGLQENETGCGIEQEPETGEYYLWVQTFLPISFFDVSVTPYNRVILNSMLNSLPDKIHVKFEFFGIGSLNDHEAFVFKPWILNVDNPMIYQMLENFHLFIPDILFYNFINRNIFIDNLAIDSFSKIRVLQNIPLENFQRFGLDRDIPKNYGNEDVEIKKIESINTSEISNFYKENHNPLTLELEHKYFRDYYNLWFSIQTTDNKHLGYIRLYFLNNSFTGGISIEYIIAKSYRNNGYGTRAVELMLNYLRNHSYAVEVGAEVHEDNLFSKRLLQTLNFKERSATNPYDRDNFIYSLLDRLEILEEDFEVDDVKILIMDYFVEKYSRYFE